MEVLGNKEFLGVALLLLMARHARGNSSWLATGTETRISCLAGWPGVYWKRMQNCTVGNKVHLSKSTAF